MYLYIASTANINRPIAKRLDAEVPHTCKHLANSALAFICAAARLASNRAICSWGFILFAHVRPILVQATDV